jgi:hypothetical protein
MHDTADLLLLPDLRVGEHANTPDVRVELVFLAMFVSEQFFRRFQDLLF